MKGINMRFIFLIFLLSVSVFSGQCSNKEFNKYGISFLLSDECNYIDDISMESLKKNGYFVSLTKIPKENYINGLSGFENLKLDLKNQKKRTIGTIPSFFIKYLKVNDYNILKEIFISPLPEDNYIGIRLSFIKDDIIYFISLVYYYNMQNNDKKNDIKLILDYSKTTNGLSQIELYLKSQNSKISTNLKKLFSLNDELINSIKIK
jgi:hypothetical protein